MKQNADVSLTASEAADSDVFAAIRRHRPELRPAEQRVADFVISNPGQFASSSISEVAALCDTSETTVSRFAKGVGYSAYAKFRLAIARAATLEQASHSAVEPVPSSDIAETEPLESIIKKLAYNERRALEETADSLDRDSLEEAVEHLVAADRIDVFGVAASGLVAADFQSKLHRVGKTIYAWTDVHSALTAAALTGPGNVYVGISHSGETTDVAAALKLASSVGAHTMALTNFAGSSIARQADLTVLTAARETTFRSGATASRMAQLLVVDILYVALATRTYTKSIAALETTRNAVTDLRQ